MLPEVLLDTPMHGTGPGNYSANFEDISGLSAGTYNVDVASGGCHATLSVIISEPNALLADGITTSINCFGGSTGAISLLVSGGTPPYTYSWTKSGGGFTSTSENILGLSAGTYSVTISDAVTPTACTLTKSFTITQPLAALAVTPTVNECELQRRFERAGSFSG